MSIPRFLFCLVGSLWHSETENSGRGKKKKMMKHKGLNNTANKKSKSASMPGLDAEQYINSNEADISLSPREELYSQSTEQLCQLLKISAQEYLRYAFSKEQLVEFLLTPKD